LSRFRNDTGGVLKVNDLMLTAGPGEEFDWPGHNPEVHGVIPGCTRLDDPAPPAGDDTKPAGKRGKAADKEAGE
jgi:hypothetical protein